MRMRAVPVFFVLFTHMAATAAAAEGGVSFGAGIEARHDSNVFRLAEDKLDRPGTDTQAGDKYYGMESAADSIVGLSGRVSYEFRSFGGRKAEFEVRPEAAIFMANEKKTHGSVEVRITQSLRKNTDLFLTAGVTPSRFSKNYLSEVDDDGSSKRYEHGVSTMAGATAGVSGKVAKSVDLSGWLGLGADTYEAPFRNRSRQLTEVGLAMEVRLAKPVKAGLAYELTLAETGNAVERTVVAGDGLSIAIDRSYRADRISPGVKVEIGSKAELRAGYELQLRDFTSDGAEDPYRGRSDVRHGFSGEARFQVSKPLRLQVGGSLTRNVTDRPNDPDAAPDEVDYERLVGWVGLAASF